MACAPESRQRLIHSGAQVGTTTIGLILAGMSELWAGIKNIRVPNV